MEEEFRFDEFAPKQFQEKQQDQEGCYSEDDYIVMEMITSGTDPKQDLLYKISAKKYHGEEFCDSFEELVRPDMYYLLSTEEAQRKEDYCIIDGGPGYYIEKYMSSMTGITNQMLFEAKPQLEVIENFREFLGVSKLYGTQLSWQIPFLNELFKSQRLSIIETCTKPTEKQCVKDSDWSLEGKVCVFTGTLTHMVRGQAMRLVTSMGGINGTSISKKTDVLILGNKESEARKCGVKSTKLRKAERLIGEGQPLILLSEDEFYQMIGYKENL